MNYTNGNRGVIQNREIASQLNDFRNLRFKNITPTDIDGFIDFGNRKFIFLEMKLMNAKIPYGQRLALERLVDSCNKEAVLIIGRHDNTKGDIDVGNCFVSEYRYKGQWIIKNNSIKIKTAVSKFLDFSS